MELAKNINEISKINFAVSILEEVNNLLSLLDLRYKKEKRITVSNSNFTQIIHILGYNYFYRFYSKQTNPFLEFYFGKINHLFQDATDTHFLDRIGAFFFANEDSAVLLRSNHEIDRILSQRSEEFPLIAEMNRIFLDEDGITDQGIILLLFLLDCSHDLSGKTPFNELKIGLLDNITDKKACLYRNIKEVSDIERFTHSRKLRYLPVSNISPLSVRRYDRVIKSIQKDFTNVCRNVILLEKAPLILGLLFLAIGYSISYVFSEYKQRPIIEYQHNTRTINKTDMSSSPISIKLNNYWGQDISHINKEHGTTFLDKLMTYCAIPDSSKVFYIHTIHIKNISFNQTIQNLNLNLNLDRADKAILYGGYQFSGTLLTSCMDSRFSNNNYYLSITLLPPDNSIEIQIISNEQNDIPLILSGINNVVLMRQSILSSMIDNWLFTILLFLASVIVIVVIHFISYSKLKKDEK